MRNYNEQSEHEYRHHIIIKLVWKLIYSLKLKHFNAIWLTKISLQCFLYKINQIIMTSTIVIYY